MPGVVLFDMDNTLYEYAPAHHAAMAGVRQKSQQLLGIGELEFQRAFEQARQEVKGRLGRTANSHSRLLYFQRMIELVGMKTQGLMTLDLEQTYWRTFLAASKLFEGVKELLEELRALEIPTAIVTDLTAQIQFRKLIYFQIDKYFDYVVTSEEAGVDKPDPAPFQLALEKFGGRVSPIWMIGDSHECDIAAARSAIGAITFQKRHEGVEISDGGSSAEVVFDSFFDLYTLLKGIDNRQRERGARKSR